MINKRLLTFLSHQRRLFIVYTVYTQEGQQHVATTEEQKAAILRRLSEIGIKDVYSPAEAAQALGVEEHILKYKRRTGRIFGTVYRNTTVYTMKQILDADLGKDRPGRKPGRKKIDGDSSSVMLLKRLSAACLQAAGQS